MKTKFTPTKTPEERTARQLQIAADKERAKQWAIARRARSDHTSLSNETRSKAEARKVIVTLQSRDAQLLKEIKEIDVALSVIKRTYK